MKLKQIIFETIELSEKARIECTLAFDNRGILSISPADYCAIQEKCGVMMDINSGEILVIYEDAAGTDRYDCMEGVNVKKVHCGYDGGNIDVEFLFKKARLNLEL